MAPKGRSRPILPTVNDSHEVEAPHAETEEDKWKRIAAKRSAALHVCILRGEPVPPRLAKEVPNPNERVAKRTWEARLCFFKDKLRKDQGQESPATSSASCGPPGTWIAAAPTTSSATADETGGLSETLIETDPESP